MSAPRQVEFRREALPPLTALEHEWRGLEAVGRTSFFTSWHWIGTLLATVPPAHRPELLRGTVRGETVALALLGANNNRRRYGLVRSRSLHLNETGDARFDSLTIEHNGLLAASEFEPVILESLTAWFADRCDEADELYFAGSQLRLPESAIEGSGLLRREIIVPSFSVDLCRLEQNGRQIFSILSANTRQQLRRAFRHYEQFGPLQLREADSGFSLR